MTEKIKNYYEFLRLITPAGVTISIVMLTLISGNLDKLDDKMFVHFTNDEMHVPRGYIVTKAEFELYKNFENEKNKRMFDDVNEIKSDIKELIKRQ